MKIRIILLFLAIIMGVAAVIGVIFYVNNIRSSVEQEVEKLEVLVAAQNIPKETSVEAILANKLVYIDAVPRKYLANGVLVSLDDYKGFVVAAPINKGEQITATNFIKPEEIGLAFLVPDNMVAISIPVDEVIGVSNLINVGDRVNVIATFQPQKQQEEDSGTEATSPEIITVTTEEGTTEGIGEAGEDSQVEIIEYEGTLTEIQREITKILLWNVEVLFVGTRTVKQENSDKNTGIVGGQKKEDELKITTITLAVTPEQSEQLVFTEEMGTVWLALLPTKDMERVETPGRTLENIFK